MTNNNEEQLPHVVISGGGPGGLLASILLNDIGIQSTVLERTSEPDQWSSKSYTIVLGDTGKSTLDKGGCLDSALQTGIERKFVYFFDGKTGDMKAIPKKSSGIGFTRPLLVECLEAQASTKPNVTLTKGVGVDKVTTTTNNNDDGPGLLCVHMEDGTTLSATHVIGADGKWSKVRQSFPKLDSQATIVTCPSFGIHIDCPTVPSGWATNGTYIVKPADECKFYVIASPRPTGGLSISIVCYDETVEKYPWIAPPEDMTVEEYGKGGWEDEYSAMPGTMKVDETLSTRLETLFREELPALHEVLDKESFQSARVNRRVSWLKMTPSEEGKKVSFSTEDGRVTLVGDAAHAMTPSMGEGCNTAMESAVKLVECVSAIMKEKGETQCSVSTLSEAFIQYGLERPADTMPVQEMSAARNVLVQKN